MKRTGILGGTFDPIHCGHMIAARAAMEQYELDEVLLMTGGNPPHKSGGEVTPARMRHEMVKLAAAGEDGMIPFDHEVEKSEPTYTAHTMAELKASYPDTEFYFIIGEDSLRDLIKWYKPEEIVKLCVILVYPRGRATALNELVLERRRELNADIRIVDAPIVEIASTDLRERIAAGKSVRYFVPDRVLDYIKEKRLYDKRGDAGQA